jgi:hypothetical protein
MWFREPLFQNRWAAQFSMSVLQKFHFPVTHTFLEQ